MEDTKFELPPVKGIDGYLGVLREWGKAQGTERLMAVDKSGYLLFDVVGNDQQVRVPEQFERGLKGYWLLHNHPSLACAISIPDIMVADSNNAEGILAICDDGSVTWTSGIAWENADPFAQLIPGLAYSSFRGIGSFVQRQVDRVAGATLQQEWKDGDERYVIQSDLICELAVREGMLKDYYRNSGPEQERILTAYKARLLDRVQPAGFGRASRPE